MTLILKQYRQAQKKLREFEVTEIERDQLKDQIKRLQKEVAMAADLQGEIDISEGKLDHMTSVLQTRVDCSVKMPWTSSPKLKFEIFFSF